MNSNNFFAELKRCNVYKVAVAYAVVGWLVVHAAQRVSELLPPQKDALLGNAVLAGLAEIEAHTGKTTDAVDLLRRLLGVPAGESVSIARLKIDPVWDPIRNDSSFQQLLTLKEHVGP